MKSKKDGLILQVCSHHLTKRDKQEQNNLQNMNQILEIFPQVGVGILQNLDDPTLHLCKKTSKTFDNFITNQKFSWIRIIHKHLGENNRFSKDISSVTKIKMASKKNFF